MRRCLLFIFLQSRATLKDNLTVKNGDVSSSTPKVCPEFLICIHYDEHSRPFHLGVSPGFKHPPSKVVLQSLAACQISYFREAEGTTIFFIVRKILTVLPKRFDSEGKSLFVLLHITCCCAKAIDIS